MCIEGQTKVAILTSPNQWFIPYAKELQRQIPQCDLYFSCEDFKQSYTLVFILSYHQILSSEFLQQHRHNLVIHASNLPKGKGWSPLFWQVLEGSNEIVFTLFSADTCVDSGDIYLQKTLYLKGMELYEELRDKQAKMCQEMCLEFLASYPYIAPKKQEGKESFYPKRTPKDSELDITKSLQSQFNLLRIVSNEEFPAFFYKDGKKFILKIYPDFTFSAGGGGIISVICLVFENYITLKECEQKEILKYRNSESVKSNLYNQHTISLQEHFAFLDSLKRNFKKQYFLIRFHSQIIGSINFSLKNNEEVEFGFFANPKFGGVGRVLEQISLFYAFNILGAKKLCLEVFCSNKQVINLHKKFGFVINGVKFVKDKEVLEMSLSR